MKKLFLILFLPFTLLSSAQTFYDFMIVDGLTTHKFITIVEGVDNEIYTVDRVTPAGTWNGYLAITRYDNYGVFLNRDIVNVTTTNSPDFTIEVALDMHYYNDSLLFFYTDSTFKPIAVRYNRDLSGYEKTYIDVLASPYRVEYLDTCIVLMCYNGNFAYPSTPKTTILYLDYDLNILELLEFNGLDPWDFQIKNGDVYFSCKNGNDVHSIQKVVDGVLVEIVSFPPDEGYQYLVPQFEFLNDTIFVASNRYHNFTILSTYNINGEYDSHIDTVFGEYQSFIKLNSKNNNVYVSWAEPFVGLNLKIIYPDSTIHHELITSNDTLMRTNMLYATDDNIYMYGGWISGGGDDWENDGNPFIVKTDEQGSFDPVIISTDNVFIDESEDTFKFYPNPVRETLTVERIDSNSNHVYIYDESGRMIFEFQISSSGINQIDLSFLDRGIYLIKDNKNHSNNKFIKL